MYNDFQELSEDMEMPFGKYQGDLISDIVTRTPNYLLYVEDTMDNVDLSDCLRNSCIVRANQIAKFNKRRNRYKGG